MQKSKIKTLLIYQILAKYSDERHPLNTTEIIEKLAEYDIPCERKSIYADVKALNAVGYDVCTTYFPKKGFFLGQRQFELPEVRLLIDAVQSAGFITPGKTESLVKKLETLVSVEQARSMVGQVYCQNDNKCDNEEIYYVIDNLHEAITKRMMVKFVYRRRNIDKENHKNYTQKTFRVSPYALIWKDDHYYLVCNNAKYDNLMNLRLDRMRKIELLDRPARPMWEVSEYYRRFDVADYASKMFNMFTGETASVRLRCDVELREEMMDRFGASIPLEAVDGEHFETVIQAAISDGLVSWLMQYGNKVRILSPSFLADMVRQRALEILKVYKNNR